ncbi:MAG: DUF1800 family protein [Kofleriaceae bacterium]
MNLRSLPLILFAAAAGCAEPTGAPPDDPPGDPAVAAATTTPGGDVIGGEAPTPTPAQVAAASRANAVRFLEQATFGARPVGAAATPPLDSVEHVMAVGVGPAITEQLGVPAGTFLPTPPRTGVCDGPFDATRDLGAQFFVAALTAADQLRLRTMFALHQILVVSENGIGENRGTCTSEKRDAMTRYLNVLRANAFGNYRDLLEKITREPAMGDYLDMANNVAFDTAGNRITPNENFARELLQLFTLGTYLLNDDGTVKLDAANQPRPAYPEGRIPAFARTLSGWTYPGTCPGLGKKNPATYTGPMIACAANHDGRASQLLNYAGAINGGLTTAGASPEVHLDEALDNLFYHPNLPPFVCKQLIQHLVTSNPSPAYVARVVAVFKDDGTAAHTRGNLRAVVRAILVDTEARTLTPLPAAGRLRSPAELIARVLRSFGTTLDLTKNPGGLLNTRSGQMGQSVPRPPSVFSYYSPDTAAPGSDDLVGPEFGLLDTGSITVRANFFHELFHGASLATNGVTFDLTGVPDDPAQLVAWIDDAWLHGAMSPELRATLDVALADSRSGSTLNKKRLALYRAAVSPEFEIQR